jgi:hypothetical protein
MLAHGGAAGLVVELGLVLILVVLGVRVWMQSKRLEEESDAARTGHEPSVEQGNGEGERERGLRDAQAEERAPARGD